MEDIKTKADYNSHPELAIDFAFEKFTEADVEPVEIVFGYEVPKLSGFVEVPAA
jgi:hypothetical protein